MALQAVTTSHKQCASQLRFMVTQDEQTTPRNANPPWAMFIAAHRCRMNPSDGKMSLAAIGRGKGCGNPGTICQWMLPTYFANYEMPKSEYEGLH